MAKKPTKQPKTEPVHLSVPSVDALNEAKALFEHPEYAALVDAFASAAKTNSVVARIVDQLDEELKRTGMLVLLDQLVDAAWVLKTISEMQEDTRKMADRTQQLLVDVICTRWVMRGTVEPIRGELATGSPDIKDVPRVPSRSKDPEAYDDALRALNVPDALIEAGSVRLHYEGMGELASALAARGLDMPKIFTDLGPAYQVNKVRLTKSKTNCLA